jgi:hypothetical protein
LNLSGYAYILDLERMKIYYFDFLPLVTEMRYSQQVWAQSDTPFWLKFEKSLYDNKIFFLVSPSKIFELKIVDIDQEWGECHFNKVRNWHPVDDNLYEFCPLKEDIVSLNKLYDIYQWK